MAKTYKPYVVMHHKEAGVDAIKLTEGPFEGIMYTYGVVNFEEDEENDTLKMNFEYEILDNGGKGFGNKEPFEQYIGDILQDLIHEGIAENSITYTGGVDENRDSDSVESDKQ